jgi:hypothetical protein
MKKPWYLEKPKKVKKKMLHRGFGALPEAYKERKQRKDWMDGILRVSELAK